MAAFTNLMLLSPPLPPFKLSLFVVGACESFVVLVLCPFLCWLGVRLKLYGFILCRGCHLRPNGLDLVFGYMSPARSTLIASPYAGSFILFSIFLEFVRILWYILVGRLSDPFMGHSQIYITGAWL